MLFKNKITVWWPFISNSKHQQKEKIRKLFSTLSDNTDIVLVMRFLFALWSIYFNFDSVMLSIKIWSFKYPEICSKYLFTCVVFFVKLNRTEKYNLLKWFSIISAQASFRTVSPLLFPIQITRHILVVDLIFCDQSIIYNNSPYDAVDHSRRCLKMTTLNRANNNRPRMSDPSQITA